MTFAYHCRMVNYLSCFCYGDILFPCLHYYILEQNSTLRAKYVTGHSDQFLEASRILKTLLKLRIA